MSGTCNGVGVVSVSNEIDTALHGLLSKKSNLFDVIIQGVFFVTNDLWTNNYTEVTNYIVCMLRSNGYLVTHLMAVQNTTSACEDTYVQIDCVAFAKSENLIGIHDSLNYIDNLQFRDFKVECTCFEKCLHYTCSRLVLNGIAFPAALQQFDICRSDMTCHFGWIVMYLHVGCRGLEEHLQKLHDLFLKTVPKSLLPNFSKF